MTRNLATLGLLALLTIALPAAMAQEEKPASNSTRPDDAAWVDDCPPDMMCAMDEPTRGPADGSCENCRGDEPVQYGPDGCIDCSSPPRDGATCMDGADAGEACDPDVQYFGGEPAPADSDAQADAAKEKAVPAPGAIAVLGIFAVLVAMVAVFARRE